MEIDRRKIPQYLMIAAIVGVVVFFNVSYFSDYVSANNEEIVDYALSDDDINPVRETAVAGLFYPADVYQLDKDLDGYLEHVPAEFSTRPHILVVPHAGYKYSAQVAAHAYKRLLPFRKEIKNVLLLGPSHREYVKGVALAEAKSFRTPLGLVKTNQQITNELKKNPLFRTNARAHRDAHALEVQMPFFQKTLDDFTIVPMLYGQANPDDIAAALRPYLADDANILIISDDLSHYLKYDEAKKADETTAAQIAEAKPVDHHQSCGATGINTAMILAKDFGLISKLLDMVNSGDASGEKTKVVGYGAWAYEEPEEEKILTGIELEEAHLQNFARHNKQALLAIVKTALETAVEQHSIYKPQRDDFNNVLFNRGASFVTLTKNGRLRGCIGSVVAANAIAIDLANNTFAAALNDSRFRPVTKDELKDISFSISLLTNFEKIEFTSADDLLSKIRPNIDGLLIKDGERQGLFLPTVWKEIPDKQDFLTELKIKAGLSPSHWSDNLQVFRFRTVEVKDDNN